MRVLCVAEKPSIAKELARILSRGHFDNRAGMHKYCRNFDFPYRLPPPLGDNRDCQFTVTSVLGHLTETDFGDDFRRWSSCDPFALFDAPVETRVTSDLRQLERNLQKEARNADILMIWTDCDREGEHIGHEVVEVCRAVNNRLRVRRARFSAIIDAQIHNACRQADDLDMRMVNAVAVRQVLDLRIGAAFTRLMTMTLQTRIPESFEKKVVSYGPCQFPTLGFVVDQYNRVQSFVPEAFWYIEVTTMREFEDEDEPVEVKFAWRRNHLFDFDIALDLAKETVERPMATVIKVETKPTTKRKPYPLTTVELQKSGSRLLGMTPKRVLDLAEKLYQKGFLSYPRTETDEYDRQFDFMSLIQKQTHDTAWAAYAQKLLDGDFERPRNGRKNDKAHPPIHPTAAALNVDADERRVYEFVTRRFLASCSSDAKGKETSVEIVIAGEYFSTSGLIILERNYLEIYPYDKWAGKKLPDFQPNEQFIPDSCNLLEGSTSKPKLLTEADLVGLMDRNGIGTDATIAEHIAKVIEREYVIAKKEGKENFLVPSTLGVGLVEGYNAIGFDRSLSKPHLRRETEHRLVLICEGQQTKAEVLSTSVEEYKEVYVKARRDFDTVVNIVVAVDAEAPGPEALEVGLPGVVARDRRGTAMGLPPNDLVKKQTTTILPIAPVTCRLFRAPLDQVPPTQVGSFMPAASLGASSATSSFGQMMAALRQFLHQLDLKPNASALPPPQRAVVGLRGATAASKLPRASQGAGQTKAAHTGGALIRATRVAGFSNGRTMTARTRLAECRHEEAEEAGQPVEGQETVSTVGVHIGRATARRLQGGRPARAAQRVREVVVDRVAVREEAAEAEEAVVDLVDACFKCNEPGHWASNCPNA
ncbi:unnamed protein product [Cutaneotrichosporon oleaginosum]